MGGAEWDRGSGTRRLRDEDNTEHQRADADRICARGVRVGGGAICDGLWRLGADRFADCRRGYASQRCQRVVTDLRAARSEQREIAAGDKGTVAQVVSTWGTRIRGVFHHLIAKASAGLFERGASNLATDYDEQIRVPHVLNNMSDPGRCCVDRAVRLGTITA